MVLVGARDNPQKIDWIRASNCGGETLKHCTAVYARAAKRLKPATTVHPPRSRTPHPFTLAGVYTRGVDPTNPHGDGLPAPSPPGCTKPPPRKSL